MLAKSRMQAHAQCQKHSAKLLVCESRELLVLVKRKIFDQKRGHKARAQCVNTEWHGSRKRVSTRVEKKSTCDNALTMTSPVHW
jgi:hypothetical protein